MSLRSDINAVRRPAALFLALEESIFFNIEHLLTGEIQLQHLNRILSFSLLCERTYALDEQDISLLARVPASRWLPVAELVSTANDIERVHELCLKGLLITDSADSVLSGLRERDLLITATEWNRYSLLAHVFTRWKDIDVLSLKEATDVLSVKDAAELNATDRHPTQDAPDPYAEFVAKVGKPPHHFHSVRPCGPNVDLPLQNHNGQLFTTLEARSTRRTFDLRAELSIEHLSTLLYYVWGCHGYSVVTDDVVGVKKTSPSGGGLHPIEVYPLILRVEGLHPGIYHYNIEHHRLDPVVYLTKEEARTSLTKYTAGQHYFQGAAAAFIMTARFYRSFWKYRRHPRAYSVIHMDAGHLSQSFYLVSTALGLGPFVTAAINGKNLDEDLGLDGISESAIAICGCGIPADNEELGLTYEKYVPREMVITSSSPTVRQLAGGVDGAPEAEPQ